MTKGQLEREELSLVALAQADDDNNNYHFDYYHHQTNLALEQENLHTSELVAAGRVVQFANPQAVAVGWLSLDLAWAQPPWRLRINKLPPLLSSCRRLAHCCCLLLWLLPLLPPPPLSGHSSRYCCRCSFGCCCRWLE
jgi:hypothetical protein